jgi:hypothetical protein
MGKTVKTQSKAKTTKVIKKAIAKKVGRIGKHVVAQHTVSMNK